MYIMDAIFYGHDEVLKDIDVIFSGYGWIVFSRILPFNTSFGKHKSFKVSKNKR